MNLKSLRKKSKIYPKKICSTCFGNVQQKLNDKKEKRKNLQFEKLQKYFPILDQTIFTRPNT